MKRRWEKANGKNVVGCGRGLIYEGYPESKERFAIKKYVLTIGKKTKMHVVANTFTNISI
jgi:hypothetical protein